MTQLETLHELERAYADAVLRDRIACGCHLELADRRESGEPGITQSDVERAAQVTELTYADRLAAYEAVNQHQAAMLQGAII